MPEGDSGRALEGMGPPPKGTMGEGRGSGEALGRRGGFEAGARDTRRRRRVPHLREGEGSGLTCGRVAPFGIARARARGLTCGRAIQCAKVASALGLDQTGRIGTEV